MEMTASRKCNLALFLNKMFSFWKGCRDIPCVKKLRGEMKKIIVLSLCCLTMLSCGIAKKDRVDQAQSELVGMSRRDLLSCAGRPAKKERLGNREIFSYAGKAAPNQPSSAAGSSPSQESCEVFFTLENEIVKSVECKGQFSSKLAKEQSCLSVLDNCIR